MGVDLIKGIDPSGEPKAFNIQGVKDAFSGTTPIPNGQALTSAVTFVGNYPYFVSEIKADQPCTLTLSWYSDQAGTNLLDTDSYSYLTSQGLRLISGSVSSDFLKVTITNSSGSAMTTFSHRLKLSPNPVVNLSELELNQEEQITALADIQAEVNDEMATTRVTIESVGEELETNNTTEHGLTRTQIQAVQTEIDAEALANRQNETTEHTSTRLTITTKSNEEQAKLDTIEASLASMELDLEANTFQLTAVNTELDTQTTALGTIDSKITSDGALTRSSIASVELDVEANTTQLIDANAELDAQTALITSVLGSLTGTNRDAFGRLRISGTGQRFDIEFIYDKQPDLIDEVTTNGTATFNGNTRDVTLAISATGTGDTSQLIGHPCPYTPGNSQLVDITGVIDFANLGTGTAEVFLRSSISGTPADLNVITQSSWTALTSGVDWADSHILSMDFQSLKVGTIRFFLVQNGTPVQIASINNDNLRNSGYWQNPTLPVSWRIWNDATFTYCEMAYGDADNAIGLRYKVAKTTSATMKAICATVKSEGGLNLQDMQGLPTSIDMGVTTKTVAGTLIPLISIRPKALFNTYKNLSLALPKSFSVSTDNPIRLVVLHDTTLTGASWVDVNTTYSAIEYDVTATALSDGNTVYSEYISTAKNTASSGQGTLGKVPLWHRLDGGTGILTIAAVRTAATSADVLAGINWVEIR